MDLLWRRGKIFVKEAFIWTLLPDDREPLGTMEGIPRNGRGRFKKVRMKFLGMSLGIDVTHVDHITAASAARLGNMH